MAEAIKRYGDAVCIEISQATDKRWDDRRRIYLGRTGFLSLCEFEYYEGSLAGKHFVCFEGGSLDDMTYWCLETSPGEAIEDGDLIIFTSRNTRYVFQLKTEDKQ